MPIPAEIPMAPAAPAPGELALTGERTLPDIPDERYWFERHVAAYRVVAGRARHRTVLDAGCGEGYGLRLLADAGARRVIGVDLDPTVVAHVERRYAAADPRIEAMAAELGSLPLDDGEVDLAVSLQVIEHLWDIPAYLDSLRRVTRPGGEIVIATPNRLTFTPGSDTPVNPFHVREFTAGELRTELAAAGLHVVAVFGLHHGPMLRTAERLLRRPLPEALGATPAARWPRWVRALVHRVDADAFRITADDLDASLDVIAVCRVPRDGRT